jgi:glycosyltransferase involved in cell wall biosynthesis
LESFGLPLIEARQAGLPILASELDYVRDVVDPEQTFDPDSPMSIARAVKRFLGVEVTPIPLLSASQFLESVFNKPAVTNP